MENALKYFENVKDSRSIRNQKHPFMTLIGTSLLASLAGIDSFSGFADYVESHFEALEKYFKFPCGSPSHDTYQRFWDALNPEEFYQSFSEFTSVLASITGTYINVDGKTIRNSGHDKALHIVSAWCQANQLILAQEKVDSKSIEQRIAYSCDDIAWLQKEHEWPGLKSIGMVRSFVNKAGKITEEQRFYISSLAADARQLNQAARLHWGVENQLHWRLDVVFNEDKACIRNDNAAENIDILRKWALNVLQKTKQKPDQSINISARKSRQQK